VPLVGTLKFLLCAHSLCILSLRKAQNFFTGDSLRIKIEWEVVFLQHAWNSEEDHHHLNYLHHLKHVSIVSTTFGAPLTKKNHTHTHQTQEPLQNISYHPVSVSCYHQQP